MANIQRRLSSEDQSCCLNSAVDKLSLEDFRPEQRKTFEFFLCGHDVFVNLPTGYGKSVIFQAAPFCSEPRQIHEKRFINVNFEVHPTKKYLSTTYSERVPFWTSTPSKIVGEQYGPGLTYVEENHFLLTGSVPVEPLRQKMMFMVYSAPLSPFNLASRLYAKFIVYAFYLVVKADVVIWANKTYRPKPNLVKEDPYIGSHRRWFSQFYTENSPRLRPADPLQWQLATVCPRFIQS